MADLCSNCGNMLKPGDKFCRRCGTPVKKSNSEPPVHRETLSYSLESGGYDNPEGTVLLGNMSRVNLDSPAVRKAEIPLLLNEMLEGCTKVVDFGTGIKYELNIPPGLSPNDVIIVEDPGLVDGSTGKPCKIELTVTIG